jgi:hypothetical protein
VSDAKFISGLIVKAPHPKAPEYVKAKISIKREELIEWLRTEQGDWINADIKVSQGGKWYAAVDDWKPNGQGGQQRQEPARRSAPPAPAFTDDDLNF